MRTPVGNRKFIPRHLRFCRASESNNGSSRMCPEAPEGRQICSPPRQRCESAETQKRKPRQGRHTLFTHMKLACLQESPEVSFMDGLDVYCVRMPKTAHREEIEIKLRVPDVAALRSRLKHLRAREISPRTYESNTLYDTPRQDLRRRGQLIRIRIEQPASSFGKRRPNENAAAILTYKGPSLDRATP